MDGAQHEVKGTALQILFELGHIVGGHAEFHAPADFQTGQLQIVVFCIVSRLIKGQDAHLSQGIVVQMVSEADFLQSRSQCGFGHGFACFVGIKGDPGVHMVVKHVPFPPYPRIV